MNDILSIITEKYTPVLSLAVYQNQAPNDSGDEYYIESYEVTPDGQVLEGKPLQAETLAGIVDCFRDKSQQQALVTGAIPRCMLHFTPTRHGDYTLVWYRPAAQKMLQFENKALKSGSAMVPAMLFIASAAHLKAFCLASNSRPIAKSKVWPAPFPNVGNTGNVCLGSAKVKTPADKTFENLITYWEQMWWASKFTHEQHAPTTGGMVKLWKGQLHFKNRPFPITKLKPTKLTYQSVISGKKKN